MTREEWDALALRAAWARHKMWCLADESKRTGERTGPCGDESRTIQVSCRGPKAGDMGFGRVIATEFWGPRPDKEEESA